MPGINVIDASALAAVTFGEPGSERAAAGIARGNLVAPHLLWHEMANVCVSKIRRRSSEREIILSAFNMATKLPIKCLDVDHAAVVELAEATGLSAYDAAYLWLARWLGATLLTMDRRLDEVWSSWVARPDDRIGQDAALSAGHIDDIIGS